MNRDPSRPPEEYLGEATPPPRTPLSQYTDDEIHAEFKRRNPPPPNPLSMGNRYPMEET